METNSKPLRRDALDNIAKLQSSALEVFLRKGLDAPLDEIARGAGVSVGTLYNRFGSREALIDSVVPDVAGIRLKALAEEVVAQPDTRKKLEKFLSGMIELQLADPALNDAILRRYPDALALTQVCDKSTNLGQELVQQARSEGTLRDDFTEEDLFALLWLAGIASHRERSPARWKESLMRSLSAAWV